MKAGVPDLAGRVVQWQRTHGRSGLPWQGTRDPYRVWLSEIMLQQTQVPVVLAYYSRFLECFPDVQALAAAHLDDVLALWSGLGYYSRARNLHRCAQQVVALHGGRFPGSAELLQTLPGIGQSTAAAVAAFCFGERKAILDGNVKRVMARCLGFDADLSVAAHERSLWDKAQALLPERSDAMPAYTQGLMDLGATVCLPRNPSCLICPLRGLCVAQCENSPQKYPVRSRKLKRGAQSLWLLRAQTSDGSVWLEKRPTPGVWAGLYCLPVFEARDALEAVLPTQQRKAMQDAAPFVHVLTHKDLHLHPVAARFETTPLLRPDGDWFTPQQWPQLGLPAPIRRLLAAA